MKSIKVPVGIEDTIRGYDTVKGYDRGDLFVHRVYKDNRKWAVTHKKSGRK